MKYDFDRLLQDAPNRGKVLLLLGCAEDGPVNVPMRVSDPTKFQVLFGDPAQGELGRAYREVYDTNANLDIHVMRVAGEHATGSFTYVYQGQMKTLLKFRSTGGGTKYNYISIEFNRIKDSQEVLRNAMIVTVRDQTYFPIERLHYYLDQYDVVNDLVSAVNADARKRLSPVTCTTEVPYETMDAVIDQMTGNLTFLTGGKDALTLSKNDRFLALDQAYRLLDGFYIDVVVPLEAFMDDTHPIAFYGAAIYGSSVYAADRDYLSLADAENQGHIVTFHEQLISFCQRQMACGICTHGVLGLNIVEDVSFVTDHPLSYMERLLNTAGFQDRYGLADFVNGEWIDKGYFLSVIAGEFIFYPDTDQAYINNAYLVYAAMVASLYGPVSTTNQPVPHPSIAMRYEFERQELQELAAMGVATFRYSAKQGIVVSNGVTAGMPDTDLHFISNVRMIQLIVSILDNVLESYVGVEIRSLIASKEMEQAIKQTLGYLASVDVGILKGYDYTLAWDQLNGTCTINLSLMPRFAFEFIRAQVNYNNKG